MASGVEMTTLIVSVVFFILWLIVTYREYKLIGAIHDALVPTAPDPRSKTLNKKTLA